MRIISLPEEQAMHHVQCAGILHPRSDQPEPKHSLLRQNLQHLRLADGIGTRNVWPLYEYYAVNIMNLLL